MSLSTNDGSILRVCASFLRQERSKRLFQNSRIIILEHILPDTEELIRNLHLAGAEIFAVVAKPYSIDSEVLARIVDRYPRILNHSYDELESTPILFKVLNSAINKSLRDGKKILVIDVGGYFAKPLSKVSKEKAKCFAGVIEDTTYGHTRYTEFCRSIHIPMYSVARSHLKEIEAYFVGRDAVSAVDLVMRELGFSMTGRSALVVGFGMIGVNVALAAKASDLQVSTYDIRDHRNLSAFMMGFQVNKKAELLRRADFVFAATGWSASGIVDATRPGLSKDEILERLKDNAVLASVGSKNNEFDVASLRELAVSTTTIGKHVEKFELPNRRRIYLIKEGTAVNFLTPGVPGEILDLVFAEIVLAMLFLLKKPNEVKLHEVNAVDEKYLSYIAKDWLRFVHPQH